MLTPAALRFVRCHDPVPLVGPDHEVEIGGAVGRPGRLGLGPGRGKSGAVSAAQWTGVPLAQVLCLGDTALEVVFTGADGGYQRSLPREVATDHWTPPAPGRYLLRCRATDARGETQPARPRWNPQGYGANGVQQIEVSVYA